MNHIHNSTVVTVEESVLRMEMVDLESQEEDAPNRVLFFKTISWMGQIRSHRRDESWSGGLWAMSRRIMTGWLINLQTFFTQRTKLKHNRWLKTEFSIVET
jgi:hypothetical protein